MDFQAVRGIQLSSTFSDCLLLDPFRHPLATMRRLIDFCYPQSLSSGEDNQTSTRSSRGAQTPQTPLPCSEKASSSIVSIKSLAKRKRAYVEISQSCNGSPDSTSPERKKRKMSRGTKRPNEEISQGRKRFPEISSPVRKKRKILEGTPLVKRTYGEILQDSKIIPEMSSPVRKKRKISEGTPLVERSSGDVSRGRKIIRRISFTVPSPPVIQMNSQRKKKNTKATTSKIWILGCSYVRLGEKEAYRVFGENFGLNAKVEWLGEGWMRWRGVRSRFLQELGTQSPPDILVIHAGGNDLGLMSAKDLASRMTYDLMQLHAEVPSMTIAYSCISARQVWRYGPPEKVECDRNIVNKHIIKAVGNCGGEVIEHPRLKYDHNRVFAADGVHFTNEGNKIFVTSIRNVLKKILQEHHT